MTYLVPGKCACKNCKVHVPYTSCLWLIKAKTPRVTWSEMQDCSTCFLILYQVVNWSVWYQSGVVAHRNLLWEQNVTITKHLKQKPNKQTNKQTSKQASKQASKQTNKQANSPHWSSKILGTTRLLGKIGQCHLASPNASLLTNG